MSSCSYACATTFRKPEGRTSRSATRALDDPAPFKSTERIYIALRSAKVVRHARRDGEIDHNLRRLPQVKDYGIGGVSGCDEIRPAFGAAPARGRDGA
jgi:hypothetical protein